MTVHQDAAPSRAKRRRLPTPLPALLVTAPVAAGLVLWATQLAPDGYAPEVAYAGGGAGVLLCAAVAAAARYRQLARRADERAAAAAGAAAVFADAVVPQLLSRLHDGMPADTALGAVQQPDNMAYQRVLQQVAEEARRSETRRAAAMASCANAAGRMQAITTSMLADLREMEHRHADADVLGDLLHLDHRTAQAGRVADSIAVLSGARSGRRWAKPIAMESILRGAMGRIAGYQRVRLRAIADIAVAGHAAEGVMHVIAELLDNACNFSPPTTEVHVYVSEVPAGTVLTIEDSGLMMSEAALRRAERAVSGTASDLSTLTGTRLGLSVVGQLAHKHGLTVSFRPSAIGGTGVVVLVPQELITRTEPNLPLQTPALPLRDDAATGAAGGAAGGAVGSGAAAGVPRGDAPAARRAVVGAGPDLDPDAAPAGLQYADFALAALPKRRRGRTLAATHPDGVPTRPESAAASETPPDAGPDAGRDGGSDAGDETRHRNRSSENGRRLEPAGSAARFGAFRRAVTGQERDAAAPPTPRTESSRSEDDQ